MRIVLNVDSAMLPAETVDDLFDSVSGLSEIWTQKLLDIEKKREKILTIPGYLPSTVNSRNFSVIGTQLRTINSFFRHHSFPEYVVICCEDKNTAAVYQQIYNFYIADTKSNRLEISESRL